MQNTIRRIPLSKVNVPIKVKMKDENGERELEFIPGQLAALVDKLIVDAMHNPYLNVILSYIDKPIIWSFDLETAASDGIRVAFNPAFAYTLLEQG
ncbi:hypothetical protein J6O48_01845 [bacterium]|nr:hypothetical protein [bacterium]